MILQALSSYYLLKVTVVYQTGSQDDLTAKQLGNQYWNGYKQMLLVVGERKTVWRCNWKTHTAHSTGISTLLKVLGPKVIQSIFSEYIMSHLFSILLCVLTCLCLDHNLPCLLDSSKNLLFQLGVCNFGLLWNCRFVQIIDIY